eukprot:810119-Amphidinium_carterae.1
MGQKVYLPNVPLTIHPKGGGVGPPTPRGSQPRSGAAPHAAVPKTPEQRAGFGCPAKVHGAAPTQVAQPQVFAVC